MDIRKRGKGLNKYSSTDENAFFRGGGITLERSGLQFSAFGSYKNIDANISKDTLSDEQFFTTILNSGIHATPSEIEDKDAIRNFQPPVDGELIMKTFNLQPCREVGLIKDAIKDAILDGVIHNNFDEAFEFMLEKATELGVNLPSDYSTFSNRSNTGK